MPPRRKVILNLEHLLRSWNDIFTRIFE